MKAARIASINFISRYRVLIAAIAGSLAWHIFCLSAVKVVSSPMPKSPVRFSKVAFLGPILSRVDMDLCAAPTSRSILETRFRKMVSALPADGIAGDSFQDPVSGSLIYARTDDHGLSQMVDETVTDEKPEPDFQAE